MKIHFVQAGETFVVNELNQFSRPKLIASDGIGYPSNQWLLSGAVEFRFGRPIKQYSVDDIVNKRVPWFYKNGKQRCFFTQYDHGHWTISMSPKLIDVMVTP